MSLRQFSMVLVLFGLFISAAVAAPVKLNPATGSMSTKEAAKLAIVGKWGNNICTSYFDSDGELRVVGINSGVGKWSIPDRTRKDEVRIIHSGVGNGLYRWSVKKGQLRLKELVPFNHQPMATEDIIFEHLK